MFTNCVKESGLAVLEDATAQQLALHQLRQLAPLRWTDALRYRQTC
jgi:hypothetical protein